MSEVDRVTLAGEIPVALLRKLVRRTIKRGAEEFLALAALLRVAQGNARNLQRASSVIVIRMAHEWSPAVTRVLNEAFAIEDRRQFLHHVMHHPKPERGKLLDVDHEEAFKRLHVFVLAEPGTQLLPEVEATKSADVAVDLCANRDLASLSRLLHTGPLSTEDCEFLRTQPISIISAVFRPGRSAKGAIARLRPLKPKENGDGTPSLETLPGLGDAGQWGRDLAIDVDLWRRGILPWSDIDKGMLLYGPPGTGKTLFARALATSCKMNFLPTSLGKWQAKGHLGDLLKAMHKSFNDARNQAPAVLFIDEIDAIGDREQFSGDFVEYHVEVVNSLLEHLDGSEERDGVIVVGACNQPNRMDRALLRAGRLEKHILFDMPDEEARNEILCYYLPEIAGLKEFLEVAQRLRGWSHADLNRLCRDAKKTARRADRPTVTMADIILSLPEKQEASKELLHRFAVHEAGHAVYALASGWKLDHVSISKEFDSADRSLSLGQTMLATIERPLKLKSDITTRISFYLAGIAAEDVLFQERSTGSAGSDDSDLSRATNLAFSLVAIWGLGPRLTVVPKRSLEDLRRDGMLRSDVEEVLKEQYDVARTVIQQSIDAVREIAGTLADTGHMTGDVASGIFEKRRSAAFALSRLLET